jgi:hypothetical protein
MFKGLDKLKGLKVSIPPKKPNVSREDDYIVTQLYEILVHAERNPKVLVNHMIELYERESKTRSWSDSLSSTAKGRKREKLVRVGGKEYNIKDIEAPSPDIYHSVYPYVFRDDLEEGEIAFFTFMIDMDGLHIARYHNLFEFGTGHVYLPDPQKEDTFMIAAGELMIQDNQLLFNLQSGSFMKELNLDATPKYKTFLVHAVKNILSYSPLHPFDRVDFVEEVIFPSIFPLNWELRRDLALPGYVITSDEKSNFMEDVGYETVEEAMDYFSRYPYERVRISQDGIVFTNPYPDQPNRFVRDDDLYSGRRRKSRRRH